MKQLLLVTCIMVGIIAYAQKTKTVSASYTFYAPETLSIEEAKREALNRAQIEAIANEFGTLIGQNNITFTRNKNGNSQMKFHSLRWSDVKGEWLETIGKPTYDINYDNNFLIVKCNVKGKAREISRAIIDILAKPLKNGTDLRYEAYNFNDGDDFFLYFESPVDGYISVYLLDEFNQIVYNILPYKAQNSASSRIVANKEYIFFSKDHVDNNERKEVDEYTLTADLGREFNTLYILFSPKEIGTQRGFSSEDYALPASISFIEFQSWLSRTLSRDKNLQLIQYPLTIEKTNF